MGIPRKEVERLIGRPLDAPAKPKTPVPKSKYRSKSEAAYALQLEARKRAGEIEDYRYEALSFRIGNDCHYRPDFVVIKHTEEIGSYRGYCVVELHEVKAPHRFREKGIVKFRAAEALYPWFKWVLVEK